MFMVQWKNNKKNGFTPHLLWGNREINSKRTRKGAGFTIIEILIVIAVITAALVVILGFFVFEAEVAEKGRIKLEAISFAREAMEAVRNFRDNTDWLDKGIGTLTAGSNYHPASSSTGWDIVLGSETINKFTRAIVFNEVYRDANDNISGSGTKDSNTRKVTVTVSWTDRQGSTDESLETYITNWRQ